MKCRDPEKVRLRGYVDVNRLEEKAVEGPVAEIKDVAALHLEDPLNGVPFEARNELFVWLLEHRVDTLNR